MFTEYNLGRSVLFLQSYSFSKFEGQNSIPGAMPMGIYSGPINVLYFKGGDEMLMDLLVLIEPFI